jgi:hypothetical protein
MGGDEVDFRSGKCETIDDFTRGCSSNLPLSEGDQVDSRKVGAGNSEMEHIRTESREKNGKKKKKKV